MQLKEHTSLNMHLTCPKTNTETKSNGDHHNNRKSGPRKQMHKTHVNITWTFSFSPPLSPFGTSIVTRLFPFHPYEPVLNMVGIKAVVPMKPGSAEVALAPSPSVTAGGVCVMLTCNGKARFLKLLAPREVYRRRRESQRQIELE